MEELNQDLRSTKIKKTKKKKIPNPKLKTYRPRKEVTERLPTGTLNKDGTPRKAWGSQKPNIYRPRHKPWMIAVSLDEDTKNFVEECATILKVRPSAFIRMCIEAIQWDQINGDGSSDLIHDLENPSEYLARKAKNHIDKQALVE